MVGYLIEVVALPTEFANEVVVDAAVGKFGGGVLLMRVDETGNQRGNGDATGVSFVVEQCELMGGDAAAGVAGAGRLGVGNSFAVATARHVSVNR